MTDPQGTTAIYPGDAAWFLDGADFLMASRVAVDADTCAFAGMPHGQQYDYHDSFGVKSRFFRYRHGTWACGEIAGRITSIIQYRSPTWSSEGLVILEEGGQIWFLGDESSAAFVVNDDAFLLNEIRMFNNNLYVAGYDGQLYKAVGKKWRHDDIGMFRAVPAQTRKLVINDFIIGTTSYACGIAERLPALFRRIEGGDWRRLSLPSSMMNQKNLNLTSLFLDRNGDVWISTSAGFLLRGREAAQFDIATEILRRPNGEAVPIRNIVSFQNEIYTGGAEVCKIHENGRFEQQFGPPVAPLEQPDRPSAIIGGFLGVAGGVMWAIQFGILSRFDGKNWERIIMPTVYNKS